MSKIKQLENQIIFLWDLQEKAINKEEEKELKEKSLLLEREMIKLA